MSRSDILVKHKEAIDQVDQMDKEAGSLIDKVNKIHDKLAKLHDKRKTLTKSFFDDVKNLGLEEVKELLKIMPEGGLSQQLWFRCLILADDIRRGKEKEEEEDDY